MLEAFSVCCAAVIVVLAILLVTAADSYRKSKEEMLVEKNYRKETQERLEEARDAIEVYQEMNGILKDRIKSLDSEIVRLRQGSFTEDEFQNLCHDRYPCSREEFERGCCEYIDKLFGEKPLPTIDPEYYM